MIKLKQILNELTASEEAHQKGYESRPFGYWAKNGKIVAKTQNDKLIPVNQGDTTALLNPQKAPDAAPTNQDIKKTQQPVYNKGTRQTKPIRPLDIQKKMSALTKKKDQTPKAEAEQPPPQVEPNPNYKPFIDIKTVNNYNQHMNDINYETKNPTTYVKPLQSYELKEYLNTQYPKGYQENDVLNTNIPGENVYFVNSAYAVSSFISYSSEKRSDAEHDELDSQCRRIYDYSLGKYFSNTNYGATKDVKDSFVDWLKGHREDPQIREEVDHHIANLVNMTKPSIRTNLPIYRGMSRRLDKLQPFLKEIEIGKLYNFPLSGFSLNASVGKNFLMNNHKNRHGVLNRITPNKNNILYCFPLFPMTLDNELLAEYYNEQEVIKYNNPPAKCIGITKLIYPTFPDFSSVGNPQLRFVYVLDFEEQEMEEQPIKEDINKKRKLSYFDEMMNTSLAEEKAEIEKDNPKYKDFYREYIHGTK